MAGKQQPSLLDVELSSVNEGYQPDSDVAVSSDGDFVDVRAEFSGYASGASSNHTDGGADEQQRLKPKFHRNDKQEVISLIYDQDDVRSSRSDLVGDSDSEDVAMAPNRDRKSARPLLFRQVSVGGQITMTLRETNPAGSIEKVSGLLRV